MTSLADPVLAIIVIGNDQSVNPTIWAIDETGVTPPVALFTGPDAQAWGMAHDQASTLYWNDGGALWRANYKAGDPALSGVTLIGNMTTPTGSAMNVTGMAYNTVTNTLYGYRSITAPGFYAINTTNAVCTLANATSGSDFGGFDYNADDGFYYGLNDSSSTTTLPGGRGVYRISGIGGSISYTKIANYPGNDIDIDGLAAAPKTLYLVNDVGTQGIPVLDLSSLTYGTTLGSPLGSGIFSAAAYVAIPEPTTLGLLGAGAMLATMRRR
jgi:hypothetical protein